MQRLVSISRIEYGLDDSGATRALVGVLVSDAEVEDFELKVLVRDQGDPSSNALAAMEIFHRLSLALVEATKPRP